MKKLFLLLIVALMFSGCDKSDYAKISGKYNGSEKKYLKLFKVDVNTPSFIDSVKIGMGGRFHIRFKTQQPEYYTLGFNDAQYITLIVAPGDNIKVQFLGKNLQDKYTIEGSPESEKIKMLDRHLEKTNSKLDSLRLVYAEASGFPGFDSVGPVLEEQFMQAIKDQRKFNISFILDNLSSLSSVKALYQKIDDETYVLYDQKDLQYLKLVSDSLNTHYPGSRQAKALASNLQQELNNIYFNRISAIADSAEPTILDAELQDINGKTVKLSSLRNKSYVLLSFWSAASQECISNNLQLKNLYNKYHKKGFEIFQVNLDESDDIWKNAVTFDELPWISVRDFSNGYSETAQIYNITSIPANYLIDINGEIIGKDLFGKSLQIKLSQIFD